MWHPLQAAVKHQQLALQRSSRAGPGPGERQQTAAALRQKLRCCASRAMTWRLKWQLTWQEAPTARDWPAKVLAYNHPVASALKYP